MKKLTIAGALLLCCVSVYGADDKKAEAELKNGGGEKVGRATFKEQKSGVKVMVEVKNLPPGSHGIHIHEVGKCDPPNFETAGEHFNPTGKKHGVKVPEGPHAGDLPNLVVNKEGKGKLEVLLPQVTLEGSSNALLNPQGTALIIHADPDDESTQPTGGSGSRIACGVIKKK